MPSVIDRVIQQAVLQVLQPLWDPTFTEHSYGFRPGRSAHQAVAQAQPYVTEGYRFVVDIDFEILGCGFIVPSGLLNGLAEVGYLAYLSV